MEKCRGIVSEVLCSMGKLIDKIKGKKEIIPHGAQHDLEASSSPSESTFFYTHNSITLYGEEKSSSHNP